MLVGTRQMAQDITKIVKRTGQLAQQTFLGIIRITEEDHKHLASDLVKLDQFLYLTDLKESLFDNYKMGSNLPMVIWSECHAEPFFTVIFCLQK